MHSFRAADPQLAIEHILARIDVTAEEVRPAFPLAADKETGRWQTAPDGRWAGGFWVGMLWLAWQHTQQEKYRAFAHEWLARLTPRMSLNNALNGLVFYYGAAMGAERGDALAARVASEAARALDQHFDPRLGIIPLGTNSTSVTIAANRESNVDGLPGIALLLWAGRNGGSTKLLEHALLHFRRHVETCQRDDGSFFQGVLFDETSGRLERHLNPRAYALTSTWSRAQSWSLSGLTLAASHDDALLRAACKAADYWIMRTRQDMIAYWDFDASTIPQAKRDTSATAMAASALWQLADLVDPSTAEIYRGHAMRTLEALVRAYMTPLFYEDPRPPGSLIGGCWQPQEGIATDNELIWGNFFLFDLLLRAAGNRAKIAPM